MIVPKIIDYHSADIDEIWNWDPSPSQEIFVNVEFVIGAGESEAGDTFQAMIVNTSALQKRATGKTILDLRGYLLVQEFNWNNILTYVEKIATDCKGETWEEVAHKLSKRLLWEYEDHEYID